MTRWVGIIIASVLLFSAGWLTCFISALLATKIDWAGKLGEKRKEES